MSLDTPVPPEPATSSHHADDSPQPSRPLGGRLVVDLSRYLPGPLTAQLLSSLGARVIKVEEPSLGDPVRFAPPRPDGQSALAALLLSGVESMALNLKKPAAIQVLEELLGQADVLVESFRPGALERLGLAPEELRRRFPQLIICSVSGWGQDGPHAHRSGHDLTYQAVAGSLAGGAGMPATPTADLLGAWSAAAAVLAALVERQETGRGCWIDAALFDAAVHSNLMGWVAEAEGPKAVGEELTLTGELVCYDLYRTADGGLLALALLEPHFWQRFCDAVGAPDLRKAHLKPSSESRRRLEQLVATRSREQWQEFMADHDLPGEPVLSAAEAAAHPQLRARSVLRQGPDGLPRLAFPARFDGQRPRSGSSVPKLGEDTSEIVDELSLPPEDLPRLRRRAGIGKRFSLKRWVAGRFAGRR